MEDLADPIVFRHRGRDLTAADIASIQATISAHAARGRTFIGVRLCEQWDWRQGNGQYKAFAARDLLLRLRRAGLVELPAPQRTKVNRPRQNYEQMPLFIQTPLTGTLADHLSVRVQPVHGAAEHYLWDYLLAHHHYLGRPTLVGEHLKQLVFLGEQVVGCLGWASAAWKIGPRDQYIGWSLAQRRARLPLLVNNVRFLVLPWVRLPSLASCVLGLSARGLSALWQQRYGHPLYLAETFVDSARFAGTCYKAANWQCVGETQGSAKRGHLYHRHGISKRIYLYPLTRHWRPPLTADLML